jgi:hypothetical protein
MAEARTGCTIRFVKQVLVTAVLVAVASALVLGVVAQAGDTPRPTSPPGEVQFGVSDDRVHAGTTFTGVTAAFVGAVVVDKVTCRATIGGRYVDEGEFRVLRGRLQRLRPILRWFYSYQRNAVVPKPPRTGVACAWRIPKAAAGKLLSTSQPGCGDACGEWGLTVTYHYKSNDPHYQGEVSASQQGGHWRVHG